MTYEEFKKLVEDGMNEKEAYEQAISSISNKVEIESDKNTEHNNTDEIIQDEVKEESNSSNDLSSKIEMFIQKVLDDYGIQIDFEIDLNQLDYKNYESFEKSIFKILSDHNVEPPVKNSIVDQKQNDNIKNKIYI